MPDFVSRLSETLDKLERVAREASLPTNTGEWWVERPTAEWAEYKPDAIVCVDGKVATMEIETALASDHIAHWDPQAVLQLVGAVRQVIDKYRTAQTTVEVSEGTVLAGAMKVNARAYLEVLKLIAAGFGITKEAP